MSRDYATQVRWALSDPVLLCERLRLTEGARRQARGCIVRCPVHADSTPSMSVSTGRDGTVRVRCFGCQWSGDALSLIAHVYGLSLSNEFRDVLIAGAKLAGNHALAEEIQLQSDKSDATQARIAELRRRMTELRPPALLPAAEYPPLAEVQTLWSSCMPANDDPDTCALLVSRRIDPDVITKLDLARVLPQSTSLPRWAIYRGRSWKHTGHRLILRAWDAKGRLRSVRAWRVTDRGTPKRLPPAGHKAAELVQANRLAWLMLAERTCPLRLYIVEGEPDWACAATTFGRGDAVIGIGSGSWTAEFVQRIPSETQVIVATHADDAGDRYAAHVLETLGDRCPAYRWRMMA